MFQSYNLFPHMSVLENVTLAPRKALGRTRAQAEQQATALLQRFGLEDKRDEFPDRLSGGQQQRVAIVRALAMQPELMLLDEVTSALDPELVADVLDVIRELALGGMTMVIATHEMAFARDIANRVCFLDAGAILEEGPPEQIFSSPRAERTQQFLQRIVDAGPALIYRLSMPAESKNIDASLEPLDEYIVVQPVSDETETRAGLILPASAASTVSCRTGHRHRRRLGAERDRAGRQGAVPARGRLRRPPRQHRGEGAEALRADRPHPRLTRARPARARRRIVRYPSRPGRSGRVAEGGALLRRYGGELLHRGFESLLLRSRVGEPMVPPTSPLLHRAAQQQPRSPPGRPSRPPATNACSWNDARLDTLAGRRQLQPRAASR